MRVQYNFQKAIQEQQENYADVNLNCKVGWENGMVYVMMSRMAPNKIDIQYAHNSWAMDEQIMMLANPLLLRARLDSMKLTLEESHGQ